MRCDYQMGKGSSDVKGKKKQNSLYNQMLMSNGEKIIVL